MDKKEALRDLGWEELWTARHDSKCKMSEARAAKKGLAWWYWSEVEKSIRYEMRAMELYAAGCRTKRYRKALFKARIARRMASIIKNMKTAEGEI